MTITYYFAQPSPLAPQTKARAVDINTLSNAVRAAFEKIPVSSQDWLGMHNFVGATLRVKTPINAADAAPKGYVDSAILQSGGLPPLPPSGTYSLYSVDGLFSAKPSGPMNDANSLAQAQAMQLALR